MAHNNLSAVLLSEATQEQNTDMRNLLIEEASMHLETAIKAGAKAAEITANLAVAYLLQGNNERAYESLQEASNMNPSPETVQRINAVRGAIEVQKGMYDEALSSLSAATNSLEVHYNKGLTTLLKKDFAQADAIFSMAMQMVEQSSEGKMHSPRTRARLHYCMAISLARQGNRENLLEHLQSAVALDPSLKERAISDLEFRNYSDIAQQL